jgi:DNA-binding NtrC family response regulator
MATVLCVGGENLQSRQLLLESAGFNAAIATNEEAALAFCRSTTVGAVILDSRSPVRPIHLAGVLKRECPSIPVVLVTDSGTVDAPGLTSAFDHILSRLDGPVVLLRTINELLADVAAISKVTEESVEETISRSRQLREGMTEMRQSMRRTRELSQEARRMRRKINER